MTFARGGTESWVQSGLVGRTLFAELETQYLAGSDAVVVLCL